MKAVMRRLIFGGLALMAGSAVAEEEIPDPAGLLKVPPAEARPTGDGDEAKAAITPSPENTPAAPDEAAADGEQVPAVEDDGVVLPAFPIARYEALWERSPFQIESVAPPVESAGLSQRYALTGLAAINGEPIAFLMERATQNRMMVKSDGTEGGISLVQVDVQQKYADSTATLRQGSEVGVVRFDAAAAAPSMMPQPGMPQPQRIMPPGMPQASIPRQPAGQIPGAPPVAQITGQPPQPQAVPAVPQMPGVVPGMPGPGVPQNGQVQGEGGQMPPPRVIRRRALIPAAP